MKRQIERNEEAAGHRAIWLLLHENFMLVRRSSVMYAWKMLCIAARSEFAWGVSAFAELVSSLAVAHCACKPKR